MTTPPQGQNPFAQGQNPYGQQAPAPQGYPQQPSPYMNQGAPVPPPAPRRSFRQYLRIGGAIVGLIVIAVGWFASRNDPETAAVGDCMHRGSSDDNRPDLEVVDCKDAKAQYKVLAKIDGSFTGTLADSKCKAEAPDFQYAYTETSKSSNFLLCLKDK